MVILCNQMVETARVAYIFPGQGAQYVGMGKELYETSPQAREIFKKANEITGLDLTNICFNGPQEKLNQTINSQLGILTVSMAALKLLSSAITPEVVAGLSLGEYSALVAAGSLSVEDSFTLVKKRAEFMKESSLENPGGMLAIIGLSRKEVDQVCQETDAQIANLNCPNQVIISGTNLEIKKAAELSLEKGAKKIVPLKVEGPFHSHLMDNAAKKLEGVLAGIKISPPRVPIVANVSADYEDSPETIKQNLINQVNHNTLWEDSVTRIASRGIKTFIEIGPGKVLKGLLRRINNDLEAYNIERPADLNKLA